jgi:hypothetical protein
LHAKHSTGRFAAAPKGEEVAAHGPRKEVVDPDAHFIDQFVLQDGVYGTPRCCRDAIEFVGLAGVRVDLAQVW